MSELISVIVPVYNVKDYLKKCVDSILNQTYPNLEVLLIDDGSTDGSNNICDDMAKKDNRIRVIHQENGGLSAARNAGLDAAIGDYIAFVDSDDYIKDTMYADMLDEMVKRNADIIVGGIGYIDEEGKKILDVNVNELLVIEDGEEKYKQLHEQDVLTVVQCNKLYKSAIFKDIRYPIGKIHEDVYVIHKELYNASKIVYIPEVYYYYVQRVGSIMNKDEDIRQIENAIEGREKRIVFFKEINEPQAYLDSVKHLVDFVTWEYDKLYLNKSYLACNRIYELLTEIIIKYNKVYLMSENAKLLVNRRRLYNIKLEYMKIKRLWRKR